MWMTLPANILLPPETCDGAVMFVPAEAVFAEIHAYHYDVVDYAMQKQVWIVSPTTLDGGAEYRARSVERYGNARAGAYHQERTLQARQGFCRASTSA